MSQGLLRKFKVGIHRDVVLDPIAHAWALNLYLAGEEYPKHTTDYFHDRFLGFDASIAEKFKVHQTDEVRHCRMLRACVDLLKTDGSSKTSLVYNETIKRYTPASFQVDPDDDREQVRLKLGHFLLHLHFLEQRVAESLGHHYEACASVGPSRIASAIGRILQDEERHRLYTIESAREILTRSELKEFQPMHYLAEKRANREFSLVQARHFQSRLATSMPISRKLIYRFFIGCMEIAS